MTCINLACVVGKGKGIWGMWEEAQGKWGSREGNAYKDTIVFYVINIHQMNVKILIKHVNHSLYTCAVSRTIAVLSSWALTLDPPHRSKILDLNTFLILLPQIQLSGCFELKNSTVEFLPFWRTKKIFCRNVACLAYINKFHFETAITKPALIIWIHWDFSIPVIHALLPK